MRTGRRVRHAATAARTAGSLVVTTLNAIGAPLAGYLGAVTAAGIVSSRTLKRDVGSGGSVPGRRFAVMVPAHDEAGGIAATLVSLQHMDYPPELFSVHVVADNCTDDTASVVRRHGCVVHERTNLDQPGKGPALNWLYQRLRDEGVEFDSVAIIDADSTVDAAFLREVAGVMDAGALAVQGFYGVRDVSSSSSAALRFAALACRHHLRPLGRTRLGGSSGLYGNGMVFDDQLMRTRQWSGHLTEDMEFQMELLLDGIRVAYAPGARLEAEMPDTLVASTTQNERWELGRVQILRRYLGPLIGRSLRGGPAGRAAYVDSAFDQLVPPLSVLVALEVLSVVASVARLAAGGRRLDRVNLLVAVGASATVVVHVVAGLRSVGAPVGVYRSLLKAPRLVIWKVALWAKVLVKPERVTWTRTARNAISTV